MTFRNTPRPSMLARVAAVAAAAALVAASCGGDSSDAVEVPPTTSAITVPETAPEPVVTEPRMHSCDYDTADIVDGFCLIDGRWWVDDGEGNWIESDGPPTTTRPAVSLSVTLTCTPLAVRPW